MSMKEMLVSIIMPAYNCERYIDEAINSVLAQTYKNWELLVIDDGSKDATFQILSEFSKNDYRIKPLKNEKNMGVSATRNRGIELASGEWIAFLDSDDIWAPSKLERQLKTADKNSAEFIFTGASYINEDGQPYKGIYEVPEIVSYNKLRNKNVISCSSVLIKKRFFNTIKMERDDLHEDYLVWLKILKLGITAYGINEPLLIYRISINSKSGNKLKTIKMTYNIFRITGIDPFRSIYFVSRNLISSIIKYIKIFGLINIIKLIVRIEGDL